MSVFRLEEGKIYFPEPTLAEDNGLLAVGGDLLPERLLLAYSNGIFPWYNEGDPILWWCPHERFVIFPDKIHISGSMKKYFRQHKVEMRINRDFADAMHRCRAKREQTGTWITDDMEEAYNRLNRLGYAAAIEAFTDGELAGGLYGVTIGRCFFGESMFSEKENGSKAALILLAQYMQKAGGLMIDCQFHTDHLESMGGERISWEEYRAILDKGISPDNMTL